MWQDIAGTVTEELKEPDDDMVMALPGGRKKSQRKLKTKQVQVVDRSKPFKVVRRSSGEIVSRLRVGQVAWPQARLHLHPGLNKSDQESQTLA